MQFGKVSFVSFTLNVCKMFFLFKTFAKCRNQTSIDWKEPVKVRYICQIKTKDIHHLILKKLSIYRHSVDICVQLKS